MTRRDLAAAGGMGLVLMLTIAAASAAVGPHAQETCIGNVCI